MTGIASMAPVNATGTAASYGGYAATPTGELSLMAQRFNPFRYILTGGAPPAAQPAPEPDPTAAPGNGYAVGGIASAIGDGSAILDLLNELGGRRHATAGYDGPGHNYADGAATSDSGANWGATNAGLSGLSPGRLGMTSGAGLGLNMIGKAVPGVGAVGALGQAVNGAVAGLQSQDAMSQATGVGSSLGQSIGGAINGALGIGTTGLGGYGPANKGGEIGMENAMDPGAAGMRSVAKDMAMNYAANGDVNNATPSTKPATVPGLGIAGIAGAAATGQAQGTGLNTQASMAAFGQGFANPTGMVGNDGVASIGGTTPGGFGSMNSEGSANTNAGNMGPNAGSEGGQMGAGAESSGGGSPGGDGSNGAGGGGNAGGGSEGYAAGGVIRDTSGGFMLKKLAHGSGLVTGLSSGRGDRIKATVPKGSYVVPADVVSGMGGGNTQAGGHMLKQMMPGTGRGLRFAQGGIAGDRPPVDIQISPGEFVVHPEHVAALGNGNPEAGANLLDALVSKVRQSNMAIAAGMPAPR